MKGPVWHHIRPAVIVAKDASEVGTPLGQAMGPPLTHAHTMAIALAAHQQLQPRR